MDIFKSLWQALVVLTIFTFWPSDKDLTQFIPSNYSAIRPLDGKPIVLQWLIYPKLISVLSLKQMEFTAELAIVVYWHDEQLRDKNDLKQLPSDISKRLWYPWMRFSNCIGCNSYIIDPSKHTFNLHGKMIWIEYWTLSRFNCEFDFSRYPFDKQQCSIVIKLITWNGHINISFPDEVYAKEIPVPPEYNLQSADRLKSENKIPTQHVFLLFLPSILIVSLSWISFWLDVNMSGPRVALGLTTLLTLSTQFSSAQKDLPAVATVKAIDIWMFTCIFMVFASLLVYARAYTSNQLKILQPTIPVQLVANSTGKKQPTRNLQVDDHNNRSKCVIYALVLLIIFWSSEKELTQLIPNNYTTVRPPSGGKLVFEFLRVLLGVLRCNIIMDLTNRFKVVHSIPKLLKCPRPKRLEIPTKNGLKRPKRTFEKFDANSRFSLPKHIDAGQHGTFPISIDPRTKRNATYVVRGFSAALSQ
uniref:Neurotransmitter-gated ion-channel ligand-binding domain-containing protein n=1 Tax=Strigamia maritima TaxID=126957 RepID=T1J030_STRMM